MQVKLTVISEPSKVAEMVPLISQYANSQNKVNTADFSANGPFHQKMEQLSRSVWAPAASGVDRQTHWYYERARGSYADDGAAQGTPARRRERERQNPRKQKFTKTDLAKYELAWMGRPNLVCLGAEKAFLRHAELMADGGEPVVDQVFFKHLVAKARLFRTTEDLFSSQDLYRATGHRALRTRSGGSPTGLRDEYISTASGSSNALDRLSARRSRSSAMRPTNTFSRSRGIPAKPRSEKLAGTPFGTRLLPSVRNGAASCRRHLSSRLRRTTRRSRRRGKWYVSISPRTPARWRSWRR